MEPYWDENFTKNDNKMNVKLYKYSPKSIVLKSDKTFGRYYSQYLKDIGGRFNRSLTFNEVKSPGWIFSSRQENQDKLISTLEKILTGEYEPNIQRDKDEDKEKKMKKLYNTLWQFIDLIPGEDEREEDSYIYLDNENMKIILYFTEEGEKEGECIYKFISNRKKLFVHQVEKLGK